MASASKLVKMPGSTIEPDLKDFIDEVLVPMLVRDALKDIAAEKLLASKASPVANSIPSALRSAEEMA